MAQLEKMTITSYSDISFAASKKLDSYTVLINPESYALTYEIARTQKTAQGKASGEWVYNHTPSQTLTFKFLFDGTGVIQSTTGDSGPSIVPSILGASKNKRDVAADINKFKGIVYGFNGETHQPPYLQLQWGVLSYNCTLQKMTLTIKLFNPDGTPLRAEAECTFTSSIDPKTLAQDSNTHSPDLTKIRTVTKGDTLPLLCYNEYGDSKYYYQVAKYNGLTDFKILTPGTKLAFPPFAK